MAVTTQTATSQPVVRLASTSQLKHAQRDALHFENVPNIANMMLTGVV